MGGERGLFLLFFKADDGWAPLLCFFLFLFLLLFFFDDEAAADEAAADNELNAAAGGDEAGRLASWRRSSSLFRLVEAKCLWLVARGATGHKPLAIAAVRSTAAAELGAMVVFVQMPARARSLGVSVAVNTRFGVLCEERAPCSSGTRRAWYGRSRGGKLLDSARWPRP